MAEHIPGARLFEQPGEDHLPWLRDADGMLDAIEEFVTGSRHHVDDDRILATVLFTDIVDSTRLAAEAGDRRWRELPTPTTRSVRARSSAFVAVG